MLTQGLQVQGQQWELLSVRQSNIQDLPHKARTLLTVNRFVSRWPLTMVLLKCSITLVATLPQALQHYLAVNASVYLPRYVFQRSRISLCLGHLYL